MVREWAPIWLESKVDLRPTSRARLEGLLRAHILPRFGQYPLNRVANSDLRNWVAQMVSEGLQPGHCEKGVQRHVTDDAVCFF